MTDLHPPSLDSTTSPSRPPLDFRPISDHEWRVLDPEYPENDPRRLVGFIEAEPTCVRVLRIGADFERFSVHTFGEAVRYFQR